MEAARLQSRERKGRPSWFRPALGGVALVVIVMLFMAIRTRNPGPGPLYNRDYGANSLGFDVTPVHPFTWANTVVDNRVGDQPLELNSVTLVEPSDGLKVIDTFVIPASSSLKVDSRSFKRRPFFSPLGGFTAVAGAAYRIVFELEVTGPGAYTSQGVRLTYSAGAKQYVITYPDLLRICAPQPTNCLEQSIPIPPPTIG